MKPLLLLLLAAGPALADNNAIMNCRQFSDSFKRLACYDAIPTQARTAAPVAAASPAPAAAAAPAKAEQNFGLEYKQKAEINELESSIVGKFDGWNPGSLIRLANGQIWRVTDDAGGTMFEKDNPKVKLVRGAFGAFYMEIDGARASPKVARVR